MDSDEDKISADVIKQNELTLNISSTLKSNSTMDCENECGSSSDMEGVTVVTHGDSSVSEGEQHGVLSSDSSPTTIEIQDMDNLLVTSNDSLNEVHLTNTGLSSEESSVRNISLQKLVTTSLDSNSNIFKRPSDINGLTKGNHSVLIKRDYSVGSLCSATSLPIGQILEKTKIIDTSL